MCHFTIAKRDLTAKIDRCKMHVPLPPHAYIIPYTTIIERKRLSPSTPIFASGKMYRQIDSSKLTSIQF